MAGLDARIISEAPDTDYKVQLPSEIRNQTLAADVTRRKLEQARDDAHRQAAARQAAQMSDGDPERYLENLQRAGLFDEAVKFQGDMDDSRKKTLDALKVQTETQETQIERALTNASLIHDEPTYQAWRAQVVKTAPQYQQLLPPNYQEGLVPQLLEVGTKSREILKAQREAIEAGLKGDHIASLGGYLASLQTPQERADALESAKTVLHYPEATVARFRGVDPNDPQYAEKVKALTLTPKDQMELADKVAAREQTAAGQALTAETTRRGQDLAAATARRGQDISSATARRGQDKSGADGAGGAKLSAGAVEKIAGVEQSLSVLDDLEKLKNDEWLGPVTGRYTEFKVSAPGAKVSDELAKFAAQTATLKNAVVKATTGAAMSEPEAKRIMAQIPQFTDKPNVWTQKAKATRENLDILRRRTIELSGGTVAPKASGAQKIGRFDVEVGP